MPGPPSLCAGSRCLHWARAWETEPHFLGLLARPHLSFGSESPIPSGGKSPLGALNQRAISSQVPKDRAHSILANVAQCQPQERPVSTRVHLGFGRSGAFLKPPPHQALPHSVSLTSWAPALQELIAGGEDTYTCNSHTDGP